MTALLEGVRETLPGAFIVGDSAQPVYAGNLYYDHDRPGGWFNAATGFGALGYAIPAAVGVALGRPGEAVVCLTGDGGAQFTLSELMVARDESLPIIFLIWNNHGYAEIGHYFESHGIDRIGVDLHTPDFVELAKSFGCSACRARDLEELKSALKTAADSSGPTVIEVVQSDFVDGYPTP